MTRLSRSCLVAFLKYLALNNGVNLKSRVVRWRSLKMAPFNRSYTTYYWSAIESTAPSCTIFYYLTLNNIVTLKSGLRVSGLRKVIENGTILKDGYGFLFTFYSNYSRIFSRCWDIDVTLKSGLEVIQDGWKLRRSIEHIRLSIGRPL